MLLDDEDYDELDEVEEDAPDPEIEHLKALWREDAISFASSFVIANKDTRVVPFDVSVPQRKLAKALAKYRRVLALKGRQMWITTWGFIHALRVCWMFPGSTCAVVMHTDANAVLISKKVAGLYRGNPVLVDLMPLKAESGHQLEFQNGSQIIFTTANGNTLRSMPINFAHFSEARDYDSLSDTLASLKLAPTGQILIETTAGGEDDFHQLWVDSDPKAEIRNDFNRIFLCWRDHPEYRSDKPLPARLLAAELEYIKKNKLSEREASWYIQEWRGLPLHKRALMQQENPSTPEEAFLLAGDKYLKRKVPIPHEPKEPDDTGLLVLHEYNPTHQYVAGIDPAPGSNEKGDPTGIVILDITARCVALTWEFRTPTREHEASTRALLAKYGDPMTVIETASEGLGLADYLRGAGVPMFHQVAFGGLAPELMPRHGWRTDVTTRPILFGGILGAATIDPTWTIGCPRLVGQLNALCYDKRGKPAAPKNGHDDLVVSFGLAIQGVQQALPPREVDFAAVQYLSPIQLTLLAIGREPVQSEHFNDMCEPQPGDFYD